MSDKISIGMAELPNRPHALYRFFDASDVLLYVGITASLGVRMGNHSKGKPWCTAVHHVAIDHFPTRQAALNAERRAIREEQPLHNQQHNVFVTAPDRPETDEVIPLEMDIIYGIIGIDQGSPELAKWIQRARESAADDEREYRGDDIEVAYQLVTNLQSDFWELQYKVSQLLAALPAEQRERYNAEEHVEPLLLLRGREKDNYYPYVLELLTADLEWAALGRLPSDEREKWLRFAYDREDQIAVLPVTAALRYYRASRAGNLDELLVREDRDGVWAIDPNPGGG